MSPFEPLLNAYITRSKASFKFIKKRVIFGSVIVTGELVLICVSIFGIIDPLVPNTFPYLVIIISVLEIFKSAKFTIDDDTNTIQMDVTSLPQNLQTMSGENVSNQFNALKMSSQQNIQNAEMQQQQIAAMAQQSVMGGALSAALQDEGFMNRAGTAAGSFMGRMMGMR